MTRNPRWSSAAVLSLLILLGGSALPVAACGPSFSVLAFTYDVHPDFPLSKFAEGDLGIINDGMARSYYVVAYRYLAGKPLSPAEQKSVVALWHSRLGEDDPELSNSLRLWIEEQKKVLGLDVPKTLRYSDYAIDSHYLYYQNCSADSFKFAAKNLHDIGTKFGDQSRELKEWTRAQNEVFCNCPSSYDKKAILRTPNLPPSAFNDLANLRLRVCSTFSELAKVALLAPAGVVESVSGSNAPEDFAKFEKLSTYPALRLAYDPAALHLFNYGTSLAQLQDLLKEPRLPPALRVELLRSIWLRAILLNNSAVALSTAPTLSKAAPAMSSLVKSWLSAKTPAERKLATAFLILRNPGMSPYIYPDYGRNTPVDKIDDYQNNWWPPKEEYDDAKEKARLKALLISLGACLTAVQRQAAEKENKALAATGAAPDYLCSLVLGAARDLPRDSRIPELLHLAVKCTRFCTTTPQTSALSKQCFQLLHRKYPASIWAKKTKFWYE